MSDAPVLLIDASPYLFRAWFSLPDSIRTPAGEPVNAVHGFAGFLVKLLREERPGHVATAFDASLTTSWRNDIYPDYKAQRGLPPEELEAQMGWARELAGALGLCPLVSERYEADDIIGALCQRHADSGLPLILVSPDKDLAQLVDEQVTLYDAARGQRFGPAEVSGKFGVEPSQVGDLLALEGDSVDNIPGVPGVGHKSALALLRHFGDLDSIYRRLDELPALDLRGARALERKLREGEQLARLSRRLVEVALDAPVPATLDELRWLGPDPEALAELCQRLGFKGLERRAMELRPGEDAT